MTTYFGFAFADSMVSEECVVSRKPLTVEEVRVLLPEAQMCLNVSHKPTIDAAIRIYGLPITIPQKPPIVKLGVGDKVIVMSVRGLPRLENRHEYTAEEISSATFVFGEWTVMK